MPPNLTPPPDEAWSDLQSGIMEWWNHQSFSFPWRESNREEWELLVTEVLLQRTRANAVAAVHDAFFRQFSSPAALGSASVAEVEGAMYSLGLSWRAKFLTQLGRRLHELGAVPETREEIESLPGAGPYVAGAFLALHRNRHATFVDANVVRLLGHYFGFGWDGETRRKRWFLDLVDRLFDHPYEPREFGYAVLDFTREVCSRTPDHEACPSCIRARCSRYATEGFSA